MRILFLFGAPTAIFSADIIFRTHITLYAQRWRSLFTRLHISLLQIINCEKRDLDEELHAQNEHHNIIIVFWMKIAGQRIRKIVRLARREHCRMCVIFVCEWAVGFDGRSAFVDGVIFIPHWTAQEEQQQ